MVYCRGTVELGGVLKMGFVRNFIYPIAVIAIAFSSSASIAHHSTAGFFDSSKKIEIAGVVTRIQWRNPHTIFEIDVADAQNEITKWTVESGSLSILRSQGLSGEMLQVGDFVKVLGNESVRNRPETFAQNMLLPGGEEVLLTLGAREYFSTAPGVVRLVGSYDEELVAEARNNADGIFRVWSRIGSDLRFKPPIFNGNTVRNLPYTEKGREVYESWDPSAEFILGCTNWNMPRLMGNPQPMEFVREGENILIRLEEGDSQRIVHMNPGTSPEPGEHSLMGYSVGRWDGDALIVETNMISESSHVMPVSNQISLLEKFEASADGTALNYEITVTDPIMLTASVTKTMTWDWRPEIQVDAYACDEEQSFN